MIATKKLKIEHIIIAVCTYKRPYELERLINNLKEINYPEGIKVQILIIDNDIDCTAKQVYEKYKSELDLIYIEESNKGFAYSRNKALEKAIELGATHLAFIDDDEIADKDWLINHINFYNEFEKIYISSGPTYNKFDGNFPKYITNNKIFNYKTKKRYGDTKKTCASGNVFFPINIAKENGIYFSNDFNSGSEDTDFFARLSAAGYVIGWNDRAVNYEITGSDRANINWILRRMYKDGYNVSTAKFKCNKSFFNLVLYVIQKFVIVFVDIVVTILALFGGLLVFFNMFSLLSKNIGKLFGAVSVMKGKR